ncbi:MAG: DUF5696 domain-containing protein [Erysipelotrichales bacterium]|nr:DUF5696 domain-containing protein [Erysipelotrichales bacterium]
MLIKIFENLTIKRVILGLTLIFVSFFSLNYFVFVHASGFESISARPFDPDGFTSINQILGLTDADGNDRGFTPDQIRARVAQHDTFYAHESPNKFIPNMTSPNGRFRMEFNEVTTHFRITDNITGEVWYSNPQQNEDGDNLASSLTTENEIRSPLILGHVGNHGSIVWLDAYSLSIQRPDDNATGRPGEKSYYFRVDAENRTITVLYDIQFRGFHYTNFPEFISEERMNEIVSRLDPNSPTFAMNILRLRTVIYAPSVEFPGYYELTLSSHAALAQSIFMEHLYRILYLEAGYNQGEFDWELDHDSQMNRESTTMERPRFKVAVEYVLTDHGLQASVLRNSIVEDENSPLARIRFLPYFGAARNGEDGHILIPDGSGALMNFQSSGFFRNFRKPIYGRDHAFVEFVRREQPQESINFPMYAKIFNRTQGSGPQSNLSFFAVLEEGDAHAYIEAGQRDRTISVTRAGFGFYVRQSDNVRIGSTTWNAMSVEIFEQDIVNTDFSIAYHFLTEDQSDYSSLAKAYQAYLINRFDFPATALPVSNGITFDINFLGVYDFRSFFLGIGRRNYASLTTFQQAQLILETLIARGITDITVNYFGWKDTGLIEMNPIHFTRSRHLGNRRDYDNFVAFLAENDIPFTKSSNLLLNNGYRNMFDVRKYTSRALSWDFSTNFPHNLATGVFDNTQMPIHTLSPRFYNNFGTRMINRYQNITGLNAIQLSDLGSILNSDFSRSNPVSRQEALLAQQNLMRQYVESGLSLKLNNPLQFALPFASFAYNVPMNASRLEVFETSIPFFQLVVSDLFAYSTPELNHSLSEGIDRIMLNLLNTGSNPSFVFSYEDTSVLLRTRYTQFFHATYSNWVDHLAELNARLRDVGIAGATLTSHRILVPRENIFEVTYSNGVRIILNFTRTQRNVDGVNVPALGFYVRP